MIETATPASLDQPETDEILKKLDPTLSIEVLRAWRKMLGPNAEAILGRLEPTMAVMLLRGWDAAKNAEDEAHADAGLRNKIAQSFAEDDAAMSADIDAIARRLDEGIPRLNIRLDKLLERQRRPLTV